MIKPLSPGMRRLLLAASVLAFLAGFQLFILTEHTDSYFAWTIQPPLTAAFLGTSYFASVLLERVTEPDLRSRMQRLKHR